MWFRKKRQTCPGQEVNLADSPNLPPSRSAMVYVNLFLIEMVGRGETERVLKQSEPLPVPQSFRSELPAFSKVINRLKGLAQLEPVIYQEPVEGTFEMMVGGQSGTVHIRAEDSNPDRMLVVRIEYGERPAGRPGV